MKRVLDAFFIAALVVCGAGVASSSFAQKTQTETPSAATTGQQPVVLSAESQQAIIKAYADYQAAQREVDRVTAIRDAAASKFELEKMRAMAEAGKNPKDWSLDRDAAGHLILTPNPQPSPNASPTPK